MNWVIFWQILGIIYLICVLFLIGIFIKFYRESRVIDITDDFIEMEKLAASNNWPPQIKGEAMNSIEPFFESHAKPPRIPYHPLAKFLIALGLMIIIATGWFIIRQEPVKVPIEIEAAVQELTANEIHQLSQRVKAIEDSIVKQGAQVAAMRTALKKAGIIGGRP